MQRQSPPKHRHDGTSPLPLGMDWSPPPKKWAGRETVWPHDPHTGWSYCLTIPSWVTLPKSRDSDPIVFYRVLVGTQSPEGITSTRVVLRRFNDFLKLNAALKKAFPDKNLPQAPPKGLLRMKTRGLLEERRRSLEEWMTKLLSDIDISRSIFVASFLELEAAARSSFQDENQQSSVSNHSTNFTGVSSSQIPPNSNLAMLAGNSSLTSDYGSDTGYEASDVGTASLGLDNNSEVGTEDLSVDEDVSSPLDKFMKYGMANIDEGLFMGQAILEQLEGFPKHKVLAREVNNIADRNMPVKNGGHARKLSAESIGSDASSQKSSEYCTTTSRHVLGNGPIELPRGSVVSTSTEDLGNSDLLHPVDVQLVLPVNQGQKMNRLLTNMQRKLVTAKTDMEDLLSRLNQETAVKEYLATKVKDLEVELETTRQKSKDTIEQAILLERERVTQMQWDMEELRRKSMEMELKLNSQREDQKVETQSTSVCNDEEKDMLLQELDVTKQQLENLSKQYDELEMKSKADIRVLVREVKSLRSSQAELKQQLNQSLEENSRIEILLQKERLKNEHTSTFWKKLLEECETLSSQLVDGKVNLLKVDYDDQVMNSPSVPDSSNCTLASEEQISRLLTKVEHLSLQLDQSIYASDNGNGDSSMHSMIKVSEDLRKLLTKTFLDNYRLRKEVNMSSRNDPKIKTITSEDRKTSPKSVVQSVDLDI